MAKICLSKILKEKEITKYRFAKMLKAEYTNTIRYYKAGFDPKLSTLEKWAKLLDVKVTDLIEE